MPPHPSRPGARPWLVVLLLSAVLASICAVAAAGPAAADPACGTTWISTGIDNWSSPNAWDHGVPTAGTNACIPDLGSQTVQVSTENPTAASLTIGPNVTLRVEGNGDDGNAALAITSGGIDNSGHIELTSSSGVFAASISVPSPGLLSSSGTIDVLPGTGGARSISGEVLNGGRFTATAGATLPGTLTNLDTGTIQVGDSAHTAVVLSVATLGNYQAANRGLGGAGTFELFATLRVPNLDIRVLATRVWLRSPAAQLQATGGGNALRHLTTIPFFGQLLLDAGTLTIDAPTVSGFIRIDAATLRTSGTTTIAQAGTVHLQNASAVLRPLTGSVLVTAAGTLSGFGQVQGPVRNAGNLFTGGLTGQQLRIGGAFTQLSSGYVGLDIFGTLANVTPIVVNGPATLAGQLDLLAAPGTTGNGLTVPALTATSRTGTFRTSFAVLSDDQRVLTSYPGARVNLTATATREDDDVRVAYEHWAGVPSPEFSRWLRTSSTTGETLSFAFSGRNVSVVTRTGPAQGRAQITIDGRNPQTLDLYSPSDSEPVHFPFTAPTAGTHTLQIKVTGTKNASSSGTAVTVRGFFVPGSGNFDLAAPQVGIGGWTRTADAAASAGSLRSATAAGRFAQTTFSPGVGINWVTQTCPSCGRAAVIIDSTVHVIDLYSPTKRNQVVKPFPVTGLTSHTVTILVLGNKNARSSGTKVVVDALRPVLPD